MAEIKGTWRARLSERAGSFRHLPDLFRLVWEASPALTIASFVLRLARALLPVVMLYVGKLIIDEVVAQSRSGAPATFADWFGDGRLHVVGLLLALEFALAIVSDLLARGSSLVDGLLSELYSNFASVRLMEHAATLDLEQFERSDQQDGLERARRQVTRRFRTMQQHDDAAFGARHRRQRAVEVP